ncbi:PAS domain S-box protein [Sphingomonas gilva]|uniref:histidine kinase n=1 Tax=Sphingomonas gilva TaxID=2305907 RepID=A0A396RRJ5_9SPHN|nr:PAS domain-containing protein [Sphingomonas gilva]RHW19019.1 PAS domain S-box protein [Sphingomonas gilva]
MHETTLRIPVETSEENRTAVILAHDLSSETGDEKLDAITRFAAALCGAPIALVSLVEKDRQRFLGRTGLDVTETPRETSFCAHAMLGSEPMIVSDATRDPRFANNPLVTGPTGIRFYAGMPLISEEGVPLGALCVIDRVPRGGLTPLQKQGLRVLADDVMARLETRRHARVARAAFDESEVKFRVLADTMPQMVWSTRPDGYHDYYNARWYEFTGMPPGSTDGEGWNGMFHPEDQERAWEVWRHSLATGDPYQVEYRLRHRSGEYRWTLGRALPIRNEAQEIIRWFGTCTDIHEHKLAMEEREVISQELSHRIKNIFSVIAGLIGFAARADPQFAETAKGLRERVLALGRAHDFVRPHSSKSRPSSAPNSLMGLLEQLFAPYENTPGERVAVSGEDAAIDDRSATPFALLFHELATNAAKYGALSNDDGRVSLSIAGYSNALWIVWKETGGPPVKRKPANAGFGSQLLELSAVRQLGGKVDRAWEEDGLCVTIVVPRSALSRQPMDG